MDAHGKFNAGISTYLVYSRNRSQIKSFFSHSAVVARVPPDNAVATRLPWLNNVVQRIMLLTIVSTMLFSIDEATTVVETGENNIDRTSLFVIVIIVAQPC